MSKRLTEEEQQLADHLIDQYREMVARRYQYEKIKQEFPDLYEGITEEVVDNVRHFFMESVYPTVEMRQKLDRAFFYLEGYVGNPVKVWGLLGNLTSAIFRFGRLFPSAVKAGIYSLRAYLDAKRFEARLLEAAIELEMKAPLTEEQFYKCISYIPRTKVEHFINDVGNLFGSMTDTELLKKTLEILRDVVKTMRRKSNIYSEDEAKSIELGIEVLQNGHDLFVQYNSRLKKEIVTAIVLNEKQFLNNIYTEDSATEADPASA